MENNNRMVKLGDAIDGELVQIENTSDNFCPTSKYMPVDNTEEVYGKSALFLSELEKEVAVNVAEGIRYKHLANMLDLDERVVKVIANRKHVRKFIQEYVAETTAVLKSKREMYIATIIEAKLDQLQGNMADASDWDVAQLIGLMDSMGKEREKAELQKTNQNQVINVLKMITKSDD